MIIRREKYEAKLIRPFAQITLPEFKQGLAQLRMFPWLTREIRSDDVLPVVKSQVPVDSREIVEWMQIAAAEGAILDACCEDYNRLGSLLMGGVSDGYIPGLRVGDLAAQSRSWDPRIAGVTVTTPRGNFDVPFPGVATGIFTDILAWARCAWAGAIQWIVSLLQWRDLASTPINSRVAFPNLGGNVAPQFLLIKSGLPGGSAPAMMLHFGFTSSRAQKVAFSLRSPSDYTSVLGSDTLDIPAGQSTLDYFILGLPVVDPFVAHLQPEDSSDSILDSLTVTPG